MKKGEGLCERLAFWQWVTEEEIPRTEEPRTEKTNLVLGAFLK